MIGGCVGVGVGVGTERFGRPTARPHSTAVKDADDDARGGVDVDARRVSRERRREGVVVVVIIVIIGVIIGIGSRKARDGDATSASSEARDAVRVHGIGHVRFVGRRGRARGGDAG